MVVSRGRPARGAAGTGRRRWAREGLVAAPRGPAPGGGPVSATHHNDLTVQRTARDRLVVEVVLEPGTALIRYAWNAKPSGYTYQAPFGPPEGSAPINRGWVGCREVRPPKSHVVAAS